MEQIKAHITGTVWKIDVAVGDAVEKETVVMILESMKMEMPVEAAVTGRIAAVHVREGEAVACDQLLATVETDPASPLYSPPT